MRKTMQEWINDNPVFWYHLFGQARLRMRNQSVVVAVFASIILILYLYILVQIARYGVEIQFIAHLQLFLICLLLPATAHSLMSSEHEKATWESLVLTRLSAAQIVVGKLLTRWLMIAMLLALFLFPAMINWGKEQSGLPLSRFFLSEGVTFTYGFALVAFTVWVSSRAKSSMAAAALSFGVQFFCLLAVPILISVLGGLPRSPDPWEESSSWLINPVGIFFNLNPFFVQTALLRTDRYADWNSSRDTTETFPLYWGSLQALVYLALGLIFVYITVRSVSWKWKKRF